MRYTDCLSIPELRVCAGKRLPRMFFDYVEQGSWTEATKRKNTTDFADITLTQRVARDISELSTAGEMLGIPVSMPCAIAPTGMAGMMYPDGEIHAARAAAQFGIPYTLSTMSICSIEDVARHTDKPFWFQLYVMKDRDFCFRLMDRAKAADCQALVLTVDLPLMGQRHKDIHNGLSVPPKPTFRNLVNIARHPRWLMGLLASSRRSFGNIKAYENAASDISKLSAWIEEQFDLSVTWEDIARFRDYWGDRKFIVKGVMHPEDAAAANATGADAIIVSNHGGRQLDGAPSTISVLPEITRHLGQSRQCEIWLDSGIRSGQDILKALSMGADGVLIGRAFLYGLAAGGHGGGVRALEILQDELKKTMALCGVRDVRQISRDIIHTPRP